MNTQHAIDLVNRELSRRARPGYAGVLAASVCVCVAVLSLWLTEPALPLRTHVAFGGVVLIGIAWIVYSAYALKTRSILLVPHQLYAARLGLACTSIFMLGATVLWLLTQAPGAAAASATGAVLMMVAIVLLRRTAGERRRLETRLRELEGDTP